MEIMFVLLHSVEKKKARGLMKGPMVFNETRRRSSLYLGVHIFEI